MKRKVIIGLVVLVVLLGSAMAYLNYRNRTLSPPGNTSLTNGDLSVAVAYSRPSVRGRVIFGTEEEGALQPYGKYWRLGANEATEVTFNKNVLFNGSPLKAGTYRLYAIPGAAEFEIIVNTETGKWGAFEPNHELDILKTKIPVEKTNALVEQYTISMEPNSTGINIIFEWASTRLVLPVQPG